MSIKIKLFGDLKKKVPQQTKNIGAPTILNIEKTGIERVLDIMEKFSIKESEVFHIFVNHKYSGFSKRVNAGDIVALFPTNMSLLYKWYYPREEDD
jgi:molybdopterin converting factor small subunit